MVLRSALTQAMKSVLVPLAGIEPALLAELDFESSASTSSATGATPRKESSGRGAGENPPGGRHKGIDPDDQAYSRGIWGSRGTAALVAALCLDGRAAFP